jgi:hypothetical protein
MTSADMGTPMNLAEFQLDPVAERFFSQNTAEEVEDPEPPPAALSPTDRRAMRATFAMLAAFAVAMAGFLVYSRVIMPQPAELTGEHGPVMDQSDGAANAAMATVTSVTTTAAPADSRLTSVQ